VRLLHIGAWVAGTLAAISLGLLAVGFLLPSTWAAEAEIRIDAPVEEVLPWLERGRAWLEWTPAPTEGVEHFGPEAGPGSGYRWDDPGYGKGAFTVVAMEAPAGEAPGVVRYTVEVEGGSIRIDGRMEVFALEGGGTVLRWHEDGDFGWNPLLGYMAGRMETLQGEQLRHALGALRRLVEEGRVPAGMVSPDRPD
jgi:hypothetical protein